MKRSILLILAATLTFPQFSFAVGDLCNSGEVTNTQICICGEYVPQANIDAVTIPQGGMKTFVHVLRLGGATNIRICPIGDFTFVSHFTDGVQMATEITN